jgi:uncharacterized delta-60 repeat protein
MVTTQFDSGSADEAHAVAVQSDGKIVAAGDSVDHFALARYDTGGSLDSAFGDGDEAATYFTWNSQDAAYAVAIQSDGKIVAAGDCFGTDYHDHFALARYKPNGSLDTTFGSLGKVTTEFTTRSDDVAFAVAIQPDGRIVAAGRFSPSTISSQFALARYLAA